MNGNLGPLVSVYQSNIDLCQQMAEIIFAGTERMERAGLKALREGLKQGLGAARDLSDGSEAASRFKPPQLEEVLGSYREIMEAIARTNAELARTMTEYCSTCSKNVAESIGEAARPAAGGAPMQQLESMMKLWGQAYQQFGDFARQATHVGEASVESAAKRVSRRH